MACKRQTLQDPFAKVWSKIWDGHENMTHIVKRCPDSILLFVLTRLKMFFTLYSENSNHWTRVVSSTIPVNRCKCMRKTTTTTCKFCSGTFFLHGFLKKRHEMYFFFSAFNKACRQDLNAVLLTRAWIWVRGYQSTSTSFRGLRSKKFAHVQCTD